MIADLLADPRALNVFIMVVFALASVRWAFAQDWGQCVYWAASFVLCYAVTFMVQK